MQHFTSLEPVHFANSWLTIGAYDGVHLGHRAIIEHLTAGAHENDAPAVVLTFHPHPIQVLVPSNNLKYLTTPERRAELLGELGVDVVITYPFTQEISQLPGMVFIEQLNHHLNFSSLWVGYDFAMGRDRDTGIDQLYSLQDMFNFKLNVIQKVINGGQTISSSQIRAFLLEGDIHTANKYLGRSYCVAGMVIPGDGRGRTIGVPTANLNIWDHQIIPKYGVYACLAIVDQQRYKAAVNIGVRPTFDRGQQRSHIEAHLLDTEINLYGKTVQLEFYHRLRSEHKFSDIQELINQINQDIAQTRRLLDI